MPSFGRMTYCQTLLRGSPTSLGSSRSKSMDVSVNSRLQTVLDLWYRDYPEAWNYTKSLTCPFRLQSTPYISGPSSRKKQHGECVQHLRMVLYANQFVGKDYCADLVNTIPDLSSPLPWDLWTKYMSGPYLVSALLERCDGLTGKEKGSKCFTIFSSLDSFHHCPPCLAV